VLAGAEIRLQKGVQNDPFLTTFFQLLNSYPPKTLENQGEIEISWPKVVQKWVKKGSK
jgi:hypothetical protein